LKATPKQVLEYAVLRLLVGVFRLLPYRGALILAFGIGAFLHFVLRFRVREARRRIRDVFGEHLPERRVKWIAWISFRNLCFNAVEIVRLPVALPHWIRQHVHMPSVEEVERRAGGPGGVVVTTMHMGNWDVVGVAAHIVGYPVFFIARRQKNPLTDGYLNRMRGVTGVETLLNDEQIARGVIRRLRRGKWLAVLPDVRSRTPALQVPFLGGHANLAEGMALFARQVNVPIVPIVSFRRKWTRLESVSYEAVRPRPELDKREDIERMMREVMALLDRIIREHPEQYFWYNKRWVLDPLPEAHKPNPSGAGNGRNEE